MGEWFVGADNDTHYMPDAQEMRECAMEELVGAVAEARRAGTRVAVIARAAVGHGATVGEVEVVLGRALG